VVSAGEDHEQVTVQLIHQTVFSVDAARPAPGKVFTQGLGFADASERIAQAGLDQLVDAPKLPAVLGLPVEVVVPSWGRPG
jgi:hypothetical protein